MGDNLPIKFFGKREMDEQHNEPGGDAKLPSWVIEDSQELMELAERIIGEVEQIKKQVSKKEKSGSFVPSLVQVTLREEAKAKTHRKVARDMVRSKKGNDIIGLTEDEMVLVKVENTAHLERIISNFSNTEKNRYGISCITDIAMFKPVVTIDSKEKVRDYKVKLINYNDYELNRAISRLFEETCSNLQISFTKTNYTDKLIIYKLQEIGEKQIENVASTQSFESIFSIEPMPQYSVGLDFLEAENNVPITKPIEGEQYAILGILDSGIQPIEHLKRWLINERFSVYPEQYVDRGHGTFVAGIAAYGDYLLDRNLVGGIGVRLFDATVFPNPAVEKISEDELIENIRAAIKQYGDKIKVWNLSGGGETEIGSTFSDSAIALDDIQDQYGVLIIKSAGNCKNFKEGRPKGKITRGADSVRSLVVGSIAHEKGRNDLAEVDWPSPFTRVGRGPGYIIKPEVVHYGGNAGVDHTGRIKITGVSSFSVNGGIREAVGTSFSTPRVAAICAGLVNEIQEEFDPLLIKALVVHSATYPNIPSFPKDERINQYGFGVPKSINEILHNNFYEATLILRDQLTKGQFIDIMDFPMPDCLIKDGYYTGEIIVTMVYNPILEPSQMEEYCQSDINIAFGSYDTKVARDTEKRNILNPVGRDETSANILSPSKYSKTKLKKFDTEFALTERQLIEYKDKYYPVKKYAVNLEDMTPKNKEQLLKDNRLWYLKIKGVYRDYIEQQALAYDETLGQEFCMIITIRDPQKKEHVYDGIAQKLDEYNFWHNNIRLRENISIHTQA